MTMYMKLKQSRLTKQSNFDTPDVMPPSTRSHCNDQLEVKAHLGVPAGPGGREGRSRPAFGNVK